MLNRWVLSRDRKTATEGAEMTRSDTDALFQTPDEAKHEAESKARGRGETAVSHNICEKWIVKNE